MDQEFMKEKPVMPLVISMALPMTFSMLVNALYNIIDSYFVAQISEDAMTAFIVSISVTESGQCSGHWFCYRNKCYDGLLSWGTETAAGR